MIKYSVFSTIIHIGFICHWITSGRGHLLNSRDLHTFRKKSNEQLRGMTVKCRSHIIFGHHWVSVFETTKEAPLNSWKHVLFFYWPWWRIVTSKKSFKTDRKPSHTPSHHHHHQHFLRLKNPSTISQKVFLKKRYTQLDLSKKIISRTW